MAGIELKTAPVDFRFPTTNQNSTCYGGGDNSGRMAALAEIGMRGATHTIGQEVCPSGDLMHLSGQEVSSAATWCTRLARGASSPMATWCLRLGRRCVLSSGVGRPDAFVWA
ncbi:Cytochrome c oxidase subunit [Quillaja saponaria]|uniref:Cytochrome c oxidase subunit n=1 Tax=Quillaja saponaria TaxID=32244 RepID=A0AAD7PMZ0_QUISA|nr:Cytochrome c oxidase subunit [Quillaja saponaria]